VLTYFTKALIMICPDNETLFSSHKYNTKYYKVEPLLTCIGSRYPELRLTRPNCICIFLIIIKNLNDICLSQLSLYIDNSRPVIYLSRQHQRLSIISDHLMSKVVWCLKWTFFTLIFFFNRWWISQSSQSHWRQKVYRRSIGRNWRNEEEVDGKNEQIRKLTIPRFYYYFVLILTR